MSNVIYREGSVQFVAEEGRYSYRRVADGHTQWDFPAGEDDMDICTTPPHVTDRTPPQIRQFRKLYEHIKNDKYLVGQRLVNYDHRRHKAQQQSAVAAAK